MTSGDEMMHDIGGFEPSDVTRVLEALDAAGIRFEIEADHTQLLAAGRTFEMAMGMYPPGSRVLIFVPESRVADAQAIVAKLFPV
jgi:hypothetical protein